MVNGTVMPVIGNTSIYTGTTSGITCLLAGTYKVTITTHMTTPGGIYAEAIIGVNSAQTGTIYLTYASPSLLTGNDRNTLCFSDLVTVGAGQTVSLMFKSTNTNTACLGMTMIIEKLD
jgi:hypothetical protein